MKFWNFIPKGYRNYSFLSLKSSVFIKIPSCQTGTSNARPYGGGADGRVPSLQALPRSIPEK